MIQLKNVICIGIQLSTKIMSISIQILVWIVMLMHLTFKQKEQNYLLSLEKNNLQAIWIKNGSCYSFFLILFYYTFQLRRYRC